MTNFSDHNNDGREITNIQQIPKVTIEAAQLFNQWSNDYKGSLSQPPEILWHYTNPDGLRGIVSSGQFWATNAAFLNDQKEVIHTLDMTSRLLQNNEQVKRCSRESPLAKGVVAILSSLDSFIKYLDAYLVCFCESRDLLSQWRAYGSGGGYAISLNGPNLLEFVHGNLASRDPGQHRVSLVQVLYAYDEQEAIISGLLEQWVNLFAQQSEWGPEPYTTSEIQLLFAECLSHLAISFKDPSFREEQEWRLIYRRSSLMNKDGTGYRISFRTRNQMLLPFVEMPKNGYSVPEEEPIPKNELLPISEVLVGPTQYPIQAGYAVQELLRAMGYKEADFMVMSSLVPLRY